MLQVLKTVLFAATLFMANQGHSQNALIVTSGANINLSGNVMLTLQDFDLENNGSINLEANSGRMIFRGDVDSRIKGNGFTSLDQLEIAKAANSKLLLDKSIQIRSGIWFNSGVMNLNSRVITLHTDAALFNESESSYLTGINGGYIEITRLLNNPQSVNPGNLGAMISSAQIPGLTIIRRGHQAQTVSAGLSSIQRFYDIIPENNTALSAQLRFYYFDSELNTSNEVQLELLRTADMINWTNRGASARNASLNYVELNNIGQFSRWTLAAPGIALPVLFLDFDAECQNGAVLVTWSTSHEINAAYFEVQASPNGMEWTTIGNVGASGNSQVTRQYQFLDVAMSGKFYRVREVDVNGQSQLTNVQLADCKQDGWQVWPNPVAGELHLSVVANTSAQAIVNVFDHLGRLVISKPVSLSQGSNQFQIPVHALTAGHYLVEMVWKDGSERKQSRFVKN